MLFEQGGGKLFWHDLKLKRVKRIRIPGLLIFFHASMCRESLVKLTGAARTTDVTQEESPMLQEQM